VHQSIILPLLTLYCLLLPVCSLLPYRGLLTVRSHGGTPRILGETTMMWLLMITRRIVISFSANAAAISVQSNIASKIDYIQT
jgi:hypothetical protein